IETRPEVGESFDPLASLFKQFELIYVVGEERDLVRVRTKYRGEEVYLYRLNTSAENARRLFLIYLRRINELADRPEFYNLLSNNCTLNIVRYANAAGREGRFDIRHLLNGLIDSYLYHSGRVDTTLPFDELRRRSLIDEAAQAADDAPDFSQRIRASLPTISDSRHRPSTSSTLNSILGNWVWVGASVFSLLRYRGASYSQIPRALAGPPRCGAGILHRLQCPASAIRGS